MRDRRDESDAAVVPHDFASRARAALVSRRRDFTQERRDVGAPTARGVAE